MRTRRTLATITVAAIGAAILGAPPSAGAVAPSGPVDQPVALVCGATLDTALGRAATRTVTGTDADDTVIDLAVTAVTPTPVTGSISRAAFIAATADGGTASADLIASADLPLGGYAVTVTSTDAAGSTASCTLNVQVSPVLTVGAVQGATLDGEDARTDRSPLAPATGNGGSTNYAYVRGVITERVLGRSSTGADQNGFFLQSRLGAEDGDPSSSDGIYVFTGTFTTLIGGYTPTVGDEVILRAKVSEYYSLTQLSGASMVQVLASGLNPDTDVTVADAVPPADSAAADRFWERHEGARLRVRSGSHVTAGREIFASTADSETWLIDRDDPLATRADPYARRVFRDTHPLDDITTSGFDNGNGQRILIGALGVKAAARNNTTLLPPTRTFDTLTGDALGAVYFAFNKYSVQPATVAFTAGSNPAGNQPVPSAQRDEQLAIATFNMANLYDYRDDPFDGCDFTGNSGCVGVRPPFDYVPASDADYQTRLAALASQVVNDLKSPDLVLAQEAEDQDICAVTAGALVCGMTDNADGKPDTLQELALAIAAAGGPGYDAAYDRTGADARGITAAFLYRTDRLSLTAPAAVDPVLGNAPAINYRGTALATNTDTQNPKTLNATLPADVDRSTGVDGANVFTRAPQVARFFVKAAPGSTEGYELWAVSNHYSSGPDSRVGQRTEQAAYGAAITAAITAADPQARIVYGGDLNVFPRPDDPIARRDTDTPSDQLGPLYRAGLRNLWDDMAAATPAAAYSYVFDGQAQTLDHLFVNDNLYRDLVDMHAAHINADYPADFAGDGARGASDHDPQVARFRSRAYLSVADTSVAEGDSGTTPMTFTISVSRRLSQDTVVCAGTLDLTASHRSDYNSLVGCALLTAGSTSVTFTVTVNGDRRIEADERLLMIAVAGPGVRYADPVAIGIIRNDD